MLSGVYPNFNRIYKYANGNPCISMFISGSQQKKIKETFATFFKLPLYNTPGYEQNF